MNSASLSVSRPDFEPKKSAASAISAAGKQMVKALLGAGVHPMGYAFQLRLEPARGGKQAHLDLDCGEIVIAVRCAMCAGVFRKQGGLDAPKGNIGKGAVEEKGTESDGARRSVDAGGVYGLGPY